ncbi:MAG TPA: HAD-IC family P-type ATPase, partial [Thermoflexales bacterium]|nr:HAD-IC family P-type ATPase [Thermoflexales bacterium]
GTLTEGKPTVTDVKVIPLFVDQAAPDEQSASNENILLALAAALEAKSEHPLGMAIVAAAKARNLHLLQVSGFKSTLGRGVSGRVEFRNGLDLRIGNIPMFDDLRMTGMDAAKTRMAELQDEGKTAVIVAKINDDGTGNVLGVIAIADVLRPDAAESIRQLKAAGVKRVVMITGDNARVAKAIARQAGVDEVYADLLPEDKVKIVKEQAVYGPVAMVGDGVNDAPALATANIGVAMGAAGTDVALETADMVLMANDLSKIPYAIGLSKKARTVVFQNLAFAGAVIVVLILTGLGLALPLPLAVIGHEGSTVLVCLNGLRLLRYKG